MNLITLRSLKSSQIESIIDTGIRIKENPRQYETLLKDRYLYMLFEKTSTRTALSFGMGFNELGGMYFFQKWRDSNFIVGEIRDEVRYIGRNADIILARLKENRDIETMAEFSPIPVINGCCNRFHPTQALADCMTVKEIFGGYDITMVYVGIWNNVFNSLAASLPRLGGKLIGVCPIVNEASISAREMSETIGSPENLTIHTGSDATPEKLRQCIQEADIVYTDAWVDMEFFNDPAFKEFGEERIKKMKPFSLTPQLLKGSPARVMHDMPIHDGYEIERTVAEANMETILHQAENRRHAAKGIVTHLLSIEV
ncbi:MAG: ornithine carbamoyltransferase [Deltaproteobacteria bacterium]|nr:ornithine carbamoyltransferase [Deltaproteobacteria bacterium]